HRGVGLLLGSDPPLRRGIHQGLDAAPWLRVRARENGGARDAGGARRAGHGTPDLAARAVAAVEPHPAPQGPARLANQPAPPVYPYRPTDPQRGPNHSKAHASSVSRAIPYPSSSNNVFASRRSAVSKPSVNHA